MARIVLCLTLSVPLSNQGISTVQFKTNIFHVSELDSFASIILTCTPPPNSPVEVQGVVTDGSAKKPGDYGRDGNDYLSVTFNPGQTEATFPLYGIEDDGLSEPDETVKLRITQVRGNASPGAISNATLVIHNASPHVSIDFPGEAYEGGPFWGAGALIVFTHRRGDTNIPVSVNFATGTKGTATPGVDFQPVTGRLEFAAGEIFKEFTVPLLDDGLVEGPETVEVLLSNPSPGATVDETPQFGTIIDDEIPANLDYSFAPEFPHWPEINQVRVQPDGKILLAGSGLYLRGQEMRILRLQADGSADTSFRAGLTNLVSTIDLDSQGKILVITRDENFHLLRLVRLLPEGAVDAEFSANLESLGEGYPGILAQTNGNIVLWNAGKLVRLRPDGSADTPFDLNVSAFRVSSFMSGANAVQQQTDGKLLLVRSASDGSNSLIRVTPDGSRDATFQELFFSSSYVRFHVLSDDRMIVYGDAGLTGRKMIRLNRNGTFDPAFPEPQFPLSRYNFYDLIGEADGRLYFNSRDSIVTINSDGSLDTSLYVETGRWSDGMGGISLDGAVLHRGAVLLWNPEISGVNGLITPLARLLLGESPDHAYAFTFDREWGGTLKGPRAMADESDGSVSLVVRRRGDTSRAATVDFATQAGSARPGFHYFPTTGTLTFAPMEAEKNVTIQLIQDEVFNGIPSFFVALSNPSVPAALDRPFQIGIRDREFGLVTGEVLSRLDGSRHWQFDLAGAGFHYDDYKNSIVEGSSDLKSWGIAPVLNFGWRIRAHLSPPAVQIAPGEGVLIFRARRD